jgi:hypothetical protein
VTEKQNTNLPFLVLMLDIIVLVLNCRCLSELLKKKFFLKSVGASTDQLNQNLLR